MPPSIIARGEFVEPVQLQVVCQSLWESLPTGLDLVDEDRLSDFGDVDQALGVFYDSVLRQAVEQGKTNEQRLRNWIDEKLITSGGTRGMVNEQDKQTAAIPTAAIDLLVSRHLVRGERRLGSRWFELAHDRFLNPIQKSNLRFSESFKTRQQFFYSYMAISGIVWSALAGFFLWRESSLWIKILFVVFAAVTGGITLAEAIRMIRSRRNPIPSRRAATVALLFLGSIGFLIAATIAAGGWWQLGYLVLLALYAAIGLFKSGDS